jgi:nucleotide-binding universal stress UspA family protein
MRSLLVPVDGSPVADRAVAHAIELARALGDTRLVLINVQSTLDHEHHGGLLSPQVQAELRLHGEQSAARARALLDASGLPYEFGVFFGHPAEVVARAAREHRCEGIVMGTRGRGEFQSALMGSTAHRVLELCDIPVTLVK